MPRETPCNEGRNCKMQTSPKTRSMPYSGIAIAVVPGTTSYNTYTAPRNTMQRGQGTAKCRPSQGTPPYSGVANAMVCRPNCLSSSLLTASCFSARNQNAAVHRLHRHLQKHLTHFVSTMAPSNFAFHGTVTHCSEGQGRPEARPYPGPGPRLIQALPVQ